MKNLYRVVVLIVAVVLALSVYGQDTTTQETTTETQEEWRQVGQQEHLDPLQSGEDVFGAVCASCHGVSGEGDFGPALAGNPVLQSAEYVVQQIFHGGGGMPAFGPPQLSEEQIANVATYIRTQWGNDFGPIDVDLVQQQVAREDEQPVEEPAAPPEEPVAEAPVEEEPVTEEPVEGAPAEEEPVEEAPAEEEPIEEEQPEEEAQQQQLLGQQVYGQICAGCHGANGEGDFGPPFVGNERLQDTELTLNQIIHGGEAMPAFGPQLSDEDIAAVATYIRTQWGNAFGAVSVEQVQQQR